MKIYKVFDYQEEKGCGSTYTSSMQKAKDVAKTMSEPSSIDLIEFNNDKASIIRQLNIAAMVEYWE